MLVLLDHLVSPPSNAMRSPVRSAPAFLRRAGCRRHPALPKSFLPTFNATVSALERSWISPLNVMTVESHRPSVRRRSAGSCVKRLGEEDHATAVQLHLHPHHLPG